MIKIFIVTYKSPHLNNNLKSLFESDASPDSYTVDIIVNHPDLDLQDEYKTKVNIHTQTLRSINSSGHLARDWNQALILGFGNLINPENEQVILCQDDMLWHKEWKTKLDEIHKKYNFYSCSWGDSFMSFLPTTISSIGLFDERFCSIGYQESDFFLRQFLFNRDKCSINDFHHNRVWNVTEDVAFRAPRDLLDKKFHTHFNGYNWHVKWRDCCTYEKYWDLFLHKLNQEEQSKILPKIPYMILYPHFEKDISFINYKKLSLIGDKRRKQGLAMRVRRKRISTKAV